ncbi:MAG: hypothetical protein HY904_11255 [Deltaproteobacteria bacterium]|nr:hypothetical protein [Deltaproteobacteria bacterium]
MPAAVLGPVENVGVLGTGTAFPSRQLDNLAVLRGLPPAAWGRRVPDPDGEELRFLAEGVEQLQGMRERAWAHVPGTPLDHAHEQTTPDLMADAARAALADAGLAPADVVLLLCSTSTPHRMTSTVSAAVGAALGTAAACMDVRTGCAGGLFALATGALYVRATGGRVLLCGGETFSKIIPAHKVAATSLGDGAAALVLGPVDGGALLSAWMQTDGTLGRIITTDGALPPTAPEMERGGYLLGGAPDELAALVPGKYVDAIRGALSHAGLETDDVTLHVPHQGGRPALLEVARRTGIPLERTHITMERHANIGTAGWMAALADARARRRVRRGDRVLFSAVGGGMSWAAAVLRWG